MCVKVPNAQRSYSQALFIHQLWYTLNKAHMIMHAAILIFKALVLMLCCVIESSSLFPFFTLFLYSIWTSQEKNILEHAFFICILILILGVTIPLSWVVLSALVCVTAAVSVVITTKMVKQHRNKGRAVLAIFMGTVLVYLWHPETLKAQWMGLGIYAGCLFISAVWLDMQIRKQKTHNWLSFNQ